MFTPKGSGVLSIGFQPVFFGLGRVLGSCQPVIRPIPAAHWAKEEITSSWYWSEKLRSSIRRQTSGGSSLCSPLPFAWKLGSLWSTKLEQVRNPA
jgi:hypothetical protein